ncbi:response regulator receiver protein [Stanieria cyanosphaera PCC 7437]|uniref:Response regulator receiver protein n=1 Tax=Stanieria cyanosphaera (strain ATCC 29371 / PCC 7437) TaxID=111780 RepID=K9XT20_STAC7|nr:response regulator [Stanieria cyanosphaera]AFZ35750.1 response regulator receiver protein [Stanieria cyanosphaera PCC 7437]
MLKQTEVNDSLLIKESQNPTIKIIIVDDQELSCKLLQIALESEPDLEIIGIANNGETALELISQLHPDIVLIDIEMPKMDGITTTQKINQSFPDTKVAIITSHNSKEYINQSLKAGAKGYLLKDTPSKELADAIRFINKDYLQFGPGLFQTIDHEVSEILTNNDEVSKNNTELVLSPNKLPSPSQEDWSLATKDLLDALPRVWTKGLFYLLIMFTAVVLPWSILAKVDETGMARGKLEPKAKIIELDAPVAGTVVAIDVKEGESVKAGQVLLEIESDVMRADLEQLEEKLTGQLNQATQLELLQNQQSLSLQTQQQQNQAQQLEKQAQIEQAKQSLDALKAVYQTQKAEKQAQIEQVQQALKSSQAAHRLAEISLKGSQDKASRYRQAFKDGVIPEDRLQEIEQQAKENQERLTQAVSDVKQTHSRLEEQQNSYDQLIKQSESDLKQAQLRLQEQERSYQSLVHSGQLALLKAEEQLKDLESQITTLNSEIAQNKSQIASLKFQLKQRVIKAPANGTIFDLPISGKGAVVQQGEEVIKIAPEHSPLVLRAKMTPTESGFLKVGMPAKIKFDAYPFQDYGVQAGRVSWISPDSKITETEQGQQETFEIEVELKRSYLEGQNQRINLTPGQTATAEVITRQRRLIDFILDPFKKLQKGGLQL